MKMDTFLCFFLFLLPFFTNPASPSPFSHNDHLTLSSTLRSSHHQEYFEVTYPPPSRLPTPTCSQQILHHSFADTINVPPYSIPYTAPSHCSPPWSRVVLHFHAKCKGEQYDRIAAIWLGGVELFRTSTAEPTSGGIFWNVRKDVTRFTSLLLRSNLDLTMMLENIVNREYTGVYHVTVTLLFYTDPGVMVSVTDPVPPCPERLNRRSRSLMNEPLLNQSPADLIIPISDDGDRGFWFRVEGENDLHSRKIQIPQNTHRAVLEVCVSFHGNDEFWYTNPPTSYIKANGLTTGRGNGAYREVFVTIDGEVVGWEVPFPVIFAGGINPLFWGPVVAIGAFNLPSYDIDLTPFLGKLLDGKEHSFGIGVAQGISYWLVNANLHLWLDHQSTVVCASRDFHRSPETAVERQEEFQGLDGEFEVEAGKETRVAGWVASSAGNVTTVVSQGFTFKNAINFRKNGTYKMVNQRFRAKKKVRLLNSKGELISSFKIKRKYPIRVVTLTEPSSCCMDDSYRLVTNVSHAFKEKYIGGCFSTSITNVQDSTGWMEVKDHSVLSGKARTKQNLSYLDRSNCYYRGVLAAEGKVVSDDSSFQCEI